MTTMKTQLRLAMRTGRLAGGGASASPSPSARAGDARLLCVWWEQERSRLLKWECAGQVRHWLGPGPVQVAQEGWQGRQRWGAMGSTLFSRL